MILASIANQKQKPNGIGNYVYLFLRDKLKLPINKAKSGIRRPSNFELLGHGFVPTYKKGKYQLVVKESSWQSLKRKLKAATKKTKPYSFDLRLAKIKEVYRGWVNKTDWQVFTANSRLLTNG
jgi:RNA-directed DNA polymerase